jgi:hypothetical protein
MKLIHLIIGHEGAKNLEAAVALDESLQGDIVVLQDTLGIGPIYVAEGQTFSNIRTAFWQTVHPNWPADQIVADAALIQKIIEEQTEESQVWFWMAPNVSDVLAYYWLLPYFKNNNGLLYTVFINSLPFFNDKGSLFYPKGFGEILPKEIVKCKRLAKDVSLADFEMDGDEWDKLAGESALVRSHEGGKKIMSRNENHYDQHILNQLQFTNGFIKANKVISQALAKVPDVLSNYFLEYRLRTLIAEEKVDTQGDTTKALKDFEVKRKETNAKTEA